jgi:hypothetical protein
MNTSPVACCCWHYGLVFLLFEWNLFAASKHYDDTFYSWTCSIFCSFFSLGDSLHFRPCLLVDVNRNCTVHFAMGASNMLIGDTMFESCFHFQYMLCWTSLPVMFMFSFTGVLPLPPSSTVCLFQEYFLLHNDFSETSSVRESTPVCLTLVSSIPSLHQQEI